MVLIALVGATEAWGQAWGRVSVFVKDSDGQPILDASITLTCKELPQFRMEAKTKKKGQAIIALADATKHYTMRIEKEGFETVEMTVKPAIQDTTEREVVLSPQGEPEIAAPVAQTSTGFLSASAQLFNEGVGLLQAGELDSAAAKFREAIADDDQLAPAHSALAAVYLQQEKHEEAIATANTFLSLAPDDPTGLRVLYDSYRALGREEDAEAVLEKLTSLGSGADNAILFYNQGVEALKTGETDVAKARFEAALEADPQLTEAIVAIGRVTLTEGDLEGAAARAEEALVLEPGNYGALLVAYDAYSRLGDTGKADETFEKLATADPKRIATLFYDNGVRSFNVGASEVAIESFERALEADPQLAKAHFHLGIAQVNAGATEQAKHHLQLFIEMAPDDPEVGTAREMLEYLGN
jgi:tetratricopeptide (TPR) repeat protein